ncbi:unnamed protein product [Calypogeia fissa]
MEAQSMLDTLTDHLAIYYRRSSSSSSLDAQRESSKARHAVVQWLAGLSCEQRRAALTFVDTSWIAVLLMMQEYLRTEGLCTFFLLPDVCSVTDRDRPKGPSGVSNSTKATTKKSGNGRGISKGRKKGGTEDSLTGDGKRVPNREFSTSGAALPLPELCFRRARGLILRSEKEIQQTSGNLLVNSIRLFSSGDGENNNEGNRLCSSSRFGINSCTLLDCVTVTEDFLADIGTFLKVMDRLSHHEFLNTSPFLSSAAAASTWEETPWLKSMGYYSMPAFIANRFEFELWAAWNRAQGTKKPPRSLSVKSTKGGTQNGWIAAGNSLGNAGAIAASVFGKKQGCMEWWRKLEKKDRAGLVKCAAAHITEVEVLKIVREIRAGRGKTNNLRTRLRSKDSGGNAKLETGNSRSISDSEVEQYVKPGTDDGQGAEITSYFAGLRALKELSECGWLLCGNSQIAESIEQDDDAGWLFGSTLECAHTFSEQIKRKVRNAVVKVKNDFIERELLGDGTPSSNKAHGGNSESKISKTKKKKRKNITAPKVEGHKDEDKIICSLKAELPQEERTQQLAQLRSDSGDVELQQARSSIVDEDWNEVKSFSGGKQHGSRKGKGRKSKGNKDDNLHQPAIGSKKAAMSAAEKLARHSVDIPRYSHGSLETVNGPCSEYDGPVTSGDRFDRNPSLNIQVESPEKFMGHCSTVKRSSSCSSVDPGGSKLEKLQRTPIPSLDSTSERLSLSNKEIDEVLPDMVVSLMEGITGPCASQTDICHVGSSLCTTPAFFREASVKMEVCPVFTSDTSDSKNDLLEDRSCGQTLFAASLPKVENGKFPFEEKQNSEPDSQNTTSTLESPIIRFGTVDAAALPDSNKTISVPVPSLLCNNEQRSLETSPSSNAKPLPSPSRNGRLRLPLSSRQLDYNSSSRHSHYQQNPLFRPGPHEWPGSPQFGYFGAYHQPKATDWLQLDVGRGWPHRMEPSLLSYRNIAPLQLRQQSGLATAESLIPITVATRNGNGMGNLDRPPLLQPSYNITPAVGYTIAASKEEPRHNVRSFFNPSPFSSGYVDVEEYGQGRSTDDSEKETRLFAYDTDVDDYGMYKSSGEFDDLDGYMISEEEGERYVEDENGSSDYHQIFGGGVMYWNASDYAGLGYSRPGSLSSEDSSWARHEADLSAVLDDIVNYQPHQSSYSNVPSCSPSPPSSSSVPKSFERLSPVASSNARTFLPRPSAAKPEFNSGKFGQPPSIGLSLDDQLVGARVPITVEVIEQIRADSSAQPILRPIVVVRERQVASGEVRRLQEAKSPHIVPRSRRDLPGHRKRPPSPVLRCVPPAPPPPPPSPVSGPRRRKGLMGARSGSSSPRHWGLVNWSYKDESDGSEGNFKGDNQEGFQILGGRKRGSTTSTPPMHPLSGALLRERLVAIPPLSLEQEHPDVSIPMKTTILHNSNPALHLALTKLLSALHGEIEAFSLLVQAENKMRKPFINMAVKKVGHSLQVLWPRSRISIFGSIATGLALPTSDVDLVVCLPPVRNLEPIKEAGILEGRNGIKETSLQHAARYLADQDWVKNDTMKTIENTPVPIIMMVAEFLPHQHEVGDEVTSPSSSPSIGNEACEEATKTENGVAMPLVESVTCREDSNLATEEKKGPWGGKAARQLVHLDISFETPSHTGLRTAELVRELVGQYPALSPLAVVLKQFLTDRSLDHPYSGGLSSYCLVLLITRFLQHQHHQGKPSSNQNLGKLFMDFLHFFGCDFDPLKVGIRIRGGGMYLARDRYNDIDPLYIEDPLHPDNNVGRNCFRILQCVKAFADGYAILERKLHDISIGSDDVNAGAEGLQLLQMILPCIMTK